MKIDTSKAAAFDLAVTISACDKPVGMSGICQEAADTIIALVVERDALQAALAKHDQAKEQIA